MTFISYQIKRLEYLYMVWGLDHSIENLKSDEYRFFKKILYNTPADAENLSLREKINIWRKNLVIFSQMQQLIYDDSFTEGPFNNSFNFSFGHLFILLFEISCNANNFHHTKENILIDCRHICFCK